MRMHINNNLISKRKRCLMSNSKFTDAGSYLNRIDLPNMKNKFFMECACSSNANDYYKECLDLIAKESIPDKQKELATKFTDNILPYVENLSYVEYYTSALRESFCKSVNNMISNRIKKLKSCDRILKNHDVICEQFDTDHFVEEKRNKGVRYIAKEICKFICKEADDFTRCQQLDAVLTETSYVLQKNSVPYNGKALVRAVTEYFLMLPDNKQQDLMAYKNVLLTHESIRDKDLGTVAYFLEVVDTTNSQIILNMNKFKTSTDKDIYAFCDFIKTIPCEEVVYRSDFLNHFGILLMFIQEFLLDPIYDVKHILQTALVSIPYTIENKMHMNPIAYTREELDQLIYFYRNAIEHINMELADIPDKERSDNLCMFKDVCIKSCNIIDPLRGMVYPKDALSDVCEIAFLTENCKEEKPCTIYEFRFKFNNILKIAQEAEEFIKTKGKALMDKIAGIRLRKKHKKISETTIYECLTENNTCDICIGLFEFEEPFRTLYKVHDVMTEMCNHINKNIIPRNNKNHVRCYYMVNEGYAEIHLEDVSSIIVDEIAKMEINENLYFTEEFKVRSLELEETANLLESVDIDFMENIVPYIESRINTLDEDAMVTLIEAMGYIENVELKDLDHIADSYINANLESDYKISKAVVEAYSVKKEYNSIPLEIQSEACDIVGALLEADEEKKESFKERINKKIKDEKFKSVSKKISKMDDKLERMEKTKKTIDDLAEKENARDEERAKKKEERLQKREARKEERQQKMDEFLNNLKLFSKGLKAKMKDMSSKEKEISRNLDMNFNRLYNGCKNALISDRREAIIKGSIIPSFSKSIKLAIGLAGITALNPVAGAATAIGGIAMSKNLTRKERLLLLDEIDTELEVLEEEISNAKSKNNTKKLRKLLQYKKDLQRQYQRIKYNVRIGKDLLPGSATGLRERD